MSKVVFVAATKQHVGKTTTCLAIMSGLLERYKHVGFIKPVGQRHVPYTIQTADGNSQSKSAGNKQASVSGGNTTGKSTAGAHELGSLSAEEKDALRRADSLKTVRVDKDVALFKDYFKLNHIDVRDMSPVVIPKNYTKRFLDGEIDEKGQLLSIKSAFENISKESEFVLAEGTGHAAVGSIVNLDNARVAKLIGAEMILVVNGGLGSAFDELALNRLVCQHHGVPIRGVIINRVMPDKEEMIKEYFSRALKRWNIPLIGCVPDKPSLGYPTMVDFENLFKTKLLAGKEHRLRHYNQVSLVAAGLNFFMERLNVEDHSKTLFITHASRKDIVLGFLAHSSIHKRRWNTDWQAGLILAGGGRLNYDLYNPKGPGGVTQYEAASPPPAVSSTGLLIDEEKGSHSDPTGIVSILKNASPTHPVLYVPNLSTYEINSQISQYTAKLSAEDEKRTANAISHYKQYINFGAVDPKN